MSVDQSGHDREAEPTPAGSAGPRGIGPVKAVEDVCGLVVGHSRTFVDDDDHRLVAVAGDAHH
jgi:hypothetical protein